MDSRITFSDTELHYIGDWASRKADALRAERMRIQADIILAPESESSWQEALSFSEAGLRVYEGIARKVGQALDIPVLTA